MLSALRGAASVLRSLVPHGVGRRLGSRHQLARFFPSFLGNLQSQRPVVLSAVFRSKHDSPSSSSLSSSSSSSTSSLSPGPPSPSLGASTRSLDSLNSNHSMPHAEAAAALATLDITIASVPKRRRKKDDLPKEAVLDCGEDAFFVAENGSTVFLGVADGVGGWAELNVDPSLFAWKVMHHSSEVAKSAKIVPTPLQVLKDAYDSTRGRNPTLLGSSTACIVSVDKSSLGLRAANLGDSGFIVLRDKQVFYRSKDQQHSFNAPYQLSCDAHGDLPEKSDTLFLQLERGDIVIVATDGLWDNMFDNNIINTAAYYGDALNSETIAREALHRAHSRTCITPFSSKARSRNYDYSGGKVDDITVLMLKVK